MARVILLVLDSVGVGALPDANLYGDEGSNTLANVAKSMGGIKLPNLEELGLGKIIPVTGLSSDLPAKAHYGKMAQKSAGKDTTTGHWELAGLVLDKAFPTYPNGFPRELIAAFEKKIGRKTIGNVPASGTAIIEELGQEHVETGHPIVYTSADSVFQIAAHEEVIPIEELYGICKIARGLLEGQHAVGRVIARPFVGTVGSFNRTVNRKDFSLEPTGATVLDKLVAAGKEVIAIGKVEDIFAGKGVSQSVYAKTNEENIEKVLEILKTDFNGLLFTNLVDFDMLYGHRNDPLGYGKKLEEFDEKLPEILSLLNNDDLLIITADHGTDPTTASTDHSREYVPILIYQPNQPAGINLSVRATFADVAQTISDYFSLEQMQNGTSMLIREVGK
ncbi:MAG: phosphopentomutase [Bacillota bacterium]|nr:phosphopentomutase [Bacillota bacterium]